MALAQASAISNGRAFVVLAKGIPTGIKYTYSNSQYAPEDMGSRSGVHDGRVRGGALSKKPLQRRWSAPVGGGETGRMSGLLVAVLD